jgi:hypothetical protein
MTCPICGRDMFEYDVKTPEGYICWWCFKQGRRIKENK